MLCLRVRLGGISFRRLDGSSSLWGFVFASMYSVSPSCGFLQSSFMYSSCGRILVVGVFRWILLFVGFCFGLVCCGLAWDFSPFGFSSIIMETGCLKSEQPLSSS